MKTLKTILLLALFFAPFSTNAEIMPPAHNQSAEYTEKVSYMKGVDVAKSLQAMVPNFNIDSLKAGLETSIY
nr:hypothetical protein [Desulfobulbaceae bacterium]